MTGEMSDRQKASFAAVSDLSKQLLTVTAGVLTITVTFSKDLFNRIPKDDRCWLVGAWIVLALSLLFGIWALMALAGSLGKTGSGGPSDTNLKVYATNIMIPVGLHVIAFLIGLALLVVAGSIAISHSPPPAQPGSTAGAVSLSERRAPDGASSGSVGIQSSKPS